MEAMKMAIHGKNVLTDLITIVMAIKIVQIRVVKECKIQIQELFAVKPTMSVPLKMEGKERAKKIFVDGVLAEAMLIVILDIAASLK
jgi:hypothetical protein